MTLDDLFDLVLNVRREAQKNGIDTSLLKITSDYIRFHEVEIELNLGDYIGHPRLIITQKEK
jgi:hypothetical protein